MEKIKVLQVGLSSYPGGVENALMSYFRRIDKNRISMDFTCFEDSLAYSDEIEKNGSMIYYLPSPKRNMLSFGKEFKKVINEGNYDIVHIHMLSAVNIFPALFAKGTRAQKIILHSHNSFLPSGKIKMIAHHILKHFICFFSKNYMACSEQAAEWLFGEKNIKNTYILNNAIDYDRFKYDEDKRKDLRKSFSIDEDTIVIGHVGRFNEEKNHSFLVDLFSEYHNKNKNSKLLLVGTGTLFEDIKKKVHNLDLEDSVIFTGGVEDTSNYYQMMDVFCMPSNFEGLGIVAIEAQASGLPCICSTGVPKKAIISKNSFRISLDDKKGWLKKIDECSHFSRNINAQKNLIESGFEVVNEVDKLEKYYTV